MRRTWSAGTSRGACVSGRIRGGPTGGTRGFIGWHLKCSLIPAATIFGSSPVSGRTCTHEHQTPYPSHRTRARVPVEWDVLHPAGDPGDPTRPSPGAVPSAL